MTEPLNRCPQCVGDKREICDIIFALTVDNETRAARSMANLFRDEGTEDMLDATSDMIQKERRAAYISLGDIACELSEHQINENVGFLKE